MGEFIAEVAFLKAGAPLRFLEGRSPQFWSVSEVGGRRRGGLFGRRRSYQRSNEARARRWWRVWTSRVHDLK